MSYVRRKTNPGKRERAARKRQRRGMSFDHQNGWFKLGSKHAARWIRNSLAVADVGRPGKSAP